MKKALVVRPGAFGDVLIVSPVFRALKEKGYKTYAFVGERGREILKNNPYVDEIVFYDKEGKENPDISKDYEKAKKQVDPDWYKDFSESIEVNLALHPRSPSYIYTKEERRAKCDKNYYEETGKWCDLDLSTNGKILPEVYFSDEEIGKANLVTKNDKFNILWCLSGSGANKAYPWVDYIIGDVLKNHNDVHFITVGDERCKIIETVKDEEITNLSGEISMRDSMALTHVVDLVVSPDTGVLHASGACEVPKIGILGHTTKENITKHFINDYTIDADEEKCQCAPCFRLIYDHKIQCPIDNLSGAAWCMAFGQPADRLVKQIKKVIDESRSRKEKETTNACVS